MLVRALNEFFLLPFKQKRLQTSTEYWKHSNAETYPQETIVLWNLRTSSGDFFVTTVSQCVTKSRASFRLAISIFCVKGTSSWSMWRHSSVTETNDVCWAEIKCICVSSWTCIRICSPSIHVASGESTIGDSIEASWKGVTYEPCWGITSTGA